VASGLSTRAAALPRSASTLAAFRPRLTAAALSAAPAVPRTGLIARMCTTTAAIQEAYAVPVKWMHWVYGGGFLTCMGTVLASQQTTGPTFLGTKGQTKGYLMMIHKSTAVILAALLVPRVVFRVASAAPKGLPGHFLEHLAANLSHVAFYGFMLAMPATGIAMGYYGGKGVPFFGVYTIPGKADKSKEDGAFAGQMFKWHKWLGGFLWYLVPVHVGAASMHALRGHSIFARIVPGLAK